jgi:transposase
VGSDVTLATLGCVQQALARDLHAGDRYVFRDRRADLVKILWHDGIGMSL